MADQKQQFLALVEQRRDVIYDALGSLEEPDKKRFVALAIRAIVDHVHRDGPCHCTVQSYFQVMIDAAQTRLELGTVDNLAYLIPYGNELTLRPSYMGMIRRVVDAGVCDHIYAEIVRKKDYRRFKSGEKRELIHRFDPFNMDRGPIVGTYSMANLANGIKDWEAMHLDDVEAIKAAARRTGKGRLGPAWQTFETEMIKKSVIRRHIKRLQGNRRVQSEQASQLAAAVALDNKDFNLESDAYKIVEPGQTDLDTTVDNLNPKRPEPEPEEATITTTAKRVVEEPPPPEPEPEPQPEPERFLALDEQQFVEEKLGGPGGWFSRDWPKVLKEHAGVDSTDQIKISKLPGIIAALEQAKVNKAKEARP